MTATTIRVQMAQRKDTAANWTAANPILLSGEIGYETDTEKFKIGDGTTNWNGLDYLPIPDGSGNLTITGNLEIGTTGTLTFEGSTANDFETTLAVTDPTADRTITLPDVSGTVVTTGDTGTVTSAMLADGTIVDADVSATAEIAVSKLANGTANQVLVTDGTDVSWSDDLTLAGNLTVNGTTTTVNTETLVVEDKNIELGVVGTPTDLTADGGGITLKGTTDKTINWVDATDAWTSSERFSVPLGSAASPSLTFTGDPNTGIYSPGADQLTISTNGTGRLHITSDGKVGISTQLPAGNFGVNGSSFFGNQSSTGTTGGVLRVHPSASSIYLQTGTNTSTGSSAALVFSSINAVNEWMRITSDGKLGLGTSAPVTALDVRGAANSQQLHLGNISDRGLNVFTALNSNSRTDCLTVFSAGDINGEFAFETPGTRYMTITSAGRVGVGSTSPDGTLHVHTASAGTVSPWANADDLTVENNGPTGISILAPDDQQAQIIFGNPSDNIGSIIRWQHDDNELQVGTHKTDGFLTLKTAVGQERARIDSSGRLLVGTSSSIAIGSSVSAQIQQLNAGGTPNLALANFVNASSGSYLILGASRGTSVGTYTAAANNDRIGSIRFAAADGTDLQSLAGSIECYAEADAASNNTPGRIVLSTTASGASSPTERVRITSAGNLGVGTTTVAGKLHTVLDTSYAAGSAWDSKTAVFGGSTSTSGAFGIAYDDTAGAYLTSIAPGVAWKPLTLHGSYLSLATDASGERARIDSSGRLLVGTSSARTVNTNTAITQIETVSQAARSLFLTHNQATAAGPILSIGKTRGTAIGSTTAAIADDFLGLLEFTGADGSALIPAASIAARVDGTPGANDMPGRLVFSTTADGASSPTERMRINNDGSIYVHTTSPNIGSGGYGLNYRADNRVMLARDVDGGGSVLQVFGTAGAAQILGDGDLQNTNNSYGALSDAKLKENIVNASSQWNDLKALRIRKYNFKAETGYSTHTQIGLVAQEVELVSPGLVGESIDEETGDSTKSVNYSVLYMKAVKALQEAMERIETLEAKVAALETP